MKHAASLTLALTIIALPAQSEQPSGMSLMERGAQMFIDGILRELEPALDGLEDLGPAVRGFAEQMGPALGELLSKVEDWSAYHPPELLDNGDIIIRRKRSGEIETPPAPEEGIEL